MDDFVIKKVKALSRKYGTRDPFVLLDALGVNVRYNYDFTRLKAFYYIMLGIPYVVINGSLEEAEQKLVAAHELGHHVLHRQLARKSPLRELGFYDLQSGPEYEANLFASELLIADTDLRDVLREDSDFYRASSVLRVPPELLAFKLNTWNKNGADYRSPISYKSDFLTK